MTCNQKSIHSLFHSQQTYAVSLSADIRLSAANELLQLEEVGGELDVVLEVVLGVEAVGARVGGVLLDVEADGGAGGAGAGQADDDAGAVVELDVDALVLADAAVEVGVGEVAGVEDLAAADGGADELAALGADELVDMRDHLGGGLALAALVVVAGEEGAAIGVPEVLLNALDAGGGTGLLANTSDDVEPGDDGPETVLLADVVRAGAERLLTADAHLVGVEETAEELPASGDLVRLDTLLLGDKVDGARGRHGAGKAVDTLLLEVGDELGVVGNDGERVAGGDERAGTVDHVAVTVTVGGGTEVNAVLLDSIDESLSVDKVGVGVEATEVRLGLAVLGAALDTELLLEDLDTVVTGDTVKAVEEDLEVLVLGEELLDQVEVEDFLQHLDVVLGAVDDLDLERAVGLGADGGEIDVRDVGDLVRGDGLGLLEHLVGDTLGRGSTVGQVVLDSKVLGGTAGVVAGGEEDTTGGLPDADQVAGSGGGHDAILADEELLHAVGRSDLCNDLGDLGVVETAITTDDEGSALSALGDGLEDGSNEVLGVVGLLEDLDLLAEAGAEGKSVSRCLQGVFPRYFVWCIPISPHRHICLCQLLG